MHIKIKTLDHNRDITSDGRIIQKRAPRNKIKKAGTVWRPTNTGKNYPAIRVNGKVVHFHRVMWETFIKPRTPGYDIDHIDGDKNNNSLNNLREVPHNVNVRAYNRPSKKTSPFRNVFFLKRYGKFQAYVSDPRTGKKISKVCQSEEEAAMYANEFMKKLGFPAQALNQI
jgi:hypothetical protein